jgi:hypothetical protein
VSSFGNVRHGVHKKNLNFIPSNGYLHVAFYLDKKMCRNRVHRLVAKTFLENPSNLPDVDHIDGDKKNNRLDNLRWASKSDNAKNFQLNKDKKTNAFGTAGQCLKFTNTNGDVMVFESIKRACAHFKKALGTIWGAMVNCEEIEKSRWRGWKIQKITREECDYYLALQIFLNCEGGVISADLLKDQTSS